MGVIPVMLLLIMAVVVGTNAVTGSPQAAMIAGVVVWLACVGFWVYVSVVGIREFGQRMDAWNARLKETQRRREWDYELQRLQALKRELGDTPDASLTARQRRKIRRRVKRANKLLPDVDGEPAED